MPETCHMVQQQKNKIPGKRGRPKGSGPTPSSWRKGQSGNPRGAEPGPAGRLGRELMAAADAVREQLVRTVVQQAIGGCLASQKLLFERALGPVRAQTLAAPLPGVAHGSVEQRLQAVLDAVGAGQISSDEASTLTSAIRQATEAAQIAQLESELASIRAMRQEGLQRLHNNALHTIEADDVRAR